MRAFPFTVGSEVIYRKSEFAQSDRVRIVSIEQRKQSRRVEIEFLDTTDKPSETVSDSRICGSWSEVVAYDALQDNWLKMRSQPRLDDIEDLAVAEVLDELVPSSVAKFVQSNALGIWDTAAMDKVLGRPMSEIVGDAFTFSTDDYLVVPPEVAMMVAEALCQRNSKPILDMVMAEEAVERDRCKRGQDYPPRSDGHVVHVSPEQAYSWYLRQVRPRHELLRQWCGHRPVAYFERLEAAEAEVRRLDILLARTIDALKESEHGAHMADEFERQHESDRITPATVRPIVDRPLAPWEMPVREVVRRGRRWW